MPGYNTGTEAICDLAEGLWLYGSRFEALGKEAINEESMSPLSPSNVFQHHCKAKKSSLKGCISTDSYPGNIPKVGSSRLNSIVSTIVPAPSVYYIQSALYFCIIEAQIE